MGDLRTVYARAARPETVPWVPDCLRCHGLKAEPQTGLNMWIIAVVLHMADAHGIELVEGDPPERPRATFNPGRYFWCETHRAFTPRTCAGPDCTAAEHAPLPAVEEGGA